MEKMEKYMIANSKSGAPKLESLPPTDDSFFQNLKGSHLQIAVWRYLLNADGEIKYLISLPVAPDVCLVPEQIMKVVRCGYTSENLCKSRN